ncbi:DUF6907 domain-containing protein [Streptomyces fumanus]|uniref:DUF6907 domain-containing protein n=1 Tax=Streptomyces fumanus TaxID=67302 RepID=UPI0033EFFE67
MANTAMPTSALPALRPGFRLVPVPVGREGNAQTAWVECPDWCVTDHSERVEFIEDVNHNGQAASLSITTLHPARVPLEVSLSWWPALEEDTQPKLAVDLDSEVEVYDRTAALALADQLVAFAAEVRRLAESLPDDSPADEDEKARRFVDRHFPRVAALLDTEDGAS